MADAVAIAAAAPAKVNLYLHVVGRRADGYHLLDGLVAFASVGDTVTAAPDDRLTLAVEGPFAAAVPADEDNLALRAARRLADAAGVAARARLTLVKRLPVASGIGGGSADAAAALKVLAALWRVRVGAADLARLALGLGADVPVCLAGRAAFVGGIGEELSPPPPLPVAALVLANPGTALATAAVFAHRSGPFSAPARFERAPADAGELARLLGERRNDLGPAAAALAPDIERVLAALDALDGALLARMSGSGATCFALFAGRAPAETAALALARARPDWWVAAADLVTDAAALA